jgi:hypothetical protein
VVCTGSLVPGVDEAKKRLAYLQRTRTARPPRMLTLTSLALARRWRFSYPRLSAVRRKRGCECGWRMALEQRARTRAIAKFAVRSSKSCTSDYADCARLRTRLLISANSETSVRVFWPARVAASISVVNKMLVARSALQARQYVSVLPGRSKSSAIRPHIEQEPIRFLSTLSKGMDTAVPFLGPYDPFSGHGPRQSRVQLEIALTAHDDRSGLFGRLSLVE